MRVLPMQVLPSSPQAAPAAYSAEDRARVAKAAQDFEAFLLSSLLRSLQQTFSGNDSDGGPGQDDYSYMGTQALASSLAAAGGIGLARLISERLAGTEAGRPQ
jgi:Rod binding domain-containing protein